MQVVFSLSKVLCCPAETFVIAVPTLLCQLTSPVKHLTQHTHQAKCVWGAGRPTETLLCISVKRQWGLYVRPPFETPPS